MGQKMICTGNHEVRVNNARRFVGRLNTPLRICSLVAVSLMALAATAEDCRRWSVQELRLTSQSTHQDPYVDVSVHATFRGPGGITKQVCGFWDGGRTFRVRFTPTLAGEWTYSTESKPADDGLNTQGTLTVGPPQSGRGFLRRDTEFPTSFVYEDGTRFFMWGTTHYHLLLNARAGDRWKEAISGAMCYGMNKARFSLTPSDRNSKSGEYPDTKPFLDQDCRKLDLTHWQTADRVIEYMNERGFVADVILFWRMPEKEVSAAKHEADQRYLRYALARYAAYPNVIWCMVNEWNYSSVPRDYWNELGRLVREEDPWSRNGELIRLHSIHQQTRPDWNFADQDWPSHAILQLGVRNRGESVRVGDEWKTPPKGATRFVYGDDWGNHSIVRNWTGTYPIVNDEYGYIGEPFDDSAGGSKRKNRPVRFSRDKHRRTMWGVAVGGGFAAAGDKNEYGNDGNPYFSVNWQETPEYEDVRRLIDFFTKRGLKYWKMAPHNELVTGTRVYALVEPGQQYVVYAANGGKCSVDLPAGCYEAKRFDPATGNETSLGEIGESDGVFQFPKGHDWVLSLQRTDS